MTIPIPISIHFDFNSGRESNTPLELWLYFMFVSLLVAMLKIRALPSAWWRVKALITLFDLLLISFSTDIFLSILLGLLV